MIKKRKINVAHFLSVNIELFFFLISFFLSGLLKRYRHYIVLAQFQTYARAGLFSVPASFL